MKSKILFYFFFTLILTLISALDQHGVDQCNCRMKSLKKIVGGDETEAHAYPWQISITNKTNDHICSGIIINKQWIATTLPCVNNSNPDDFYIRVGVHDLSNPLYKSLVYDIEEIKTNEAKYPALIKLKEPIYFFKGFIEPACLRLSFIKYDEPLTATGWGSTTKTIEKDFSKTVEKGSLSNILKEIDYKVDYSIDCLKEFICVKEIKKDESVCHGDEGGPIHYTKNGRITVDGLLYPLEMKKFFFNRNYCIGEAKFINFLESKTWLEKIVGQEHC